LAEFKRFALIEKYGPIAEYIPVLILILIGAGLAFLLTNASRLLGPFRPNKIKNSIYESGMDVVGAAHERFSVKFYLVAMLFILFDIEIVFMYPWAVQFKELIAFDQANDGSGLFPIVEMGLFVVILFAGYIYVYKKGGLTWT